MRWRVHPARISVLRGMSPGQLSRRRIKLQTSDPMDIVAGDMPDDQRMEEDRVAEMQQHSESEKEHASGEKSEDEAENPGDQEDQEESEMEECDSDDGCDDKGAQEGEESEECKACDKDDSDMDDVDN